MQGAHEFLTTLAVVLGVAGATTLLFQRLHQPVVFGYLLAGLIIGPHTSIPLIADLPTVQTLAELGVILLMFSLGLELSVRRLIKLGPVVGLIGLGETSAMMWLGYLLGQILGLTPLESIYVGGIVAISSTTIIIKAFEELGYKERFTRLVFGILIVEDVIAIFLLALLTTISGGESITAESMLITAGRLFGFLVLLVGVGLLVVPRLVRVVIRLGRPETTLVTSIGICFASALLALELGYSVALGAFIAGSLVAESGHARVIEPLVQPVRDMFGAIFFVAVGMLIDPRLIGANLGAVFGFIALVMVGKVTAVSLMGFTTGQGVRTSVQAGMSMAQIGEFSFIIAGLGVAQGATGPFLYPVAVAVSAVTALTTPWLLRASAPSASWVDRKLPRTLQTFVALYGSWIERIREARPERPNRRNLRRPALLLFVDAVLLASIVIGVALEIDRAAVFLAAMFNLTPAVGRWIILGGALVCAAPICIGILRVTGFLSTELAQRAFPPGQPGKVDLAAAPRGALAVTLQIMFVFLVGAPIVAITQPFVPLLRGTLLLLFIIGVLIVAFWRSAANLQGHARAGAEAIVMALSRQLAQERTDEVDEDLARVHEVLPGLGEPVPVKLPPGTRAVNHTLAELDLRGQTGATVLAILREGQDVLLPSGRETLNAGDVLFLAGTHRAVAAAREHLLADHSS